MFYLFSWIFSQICRLFACLSFLYAFDKKKVFFFVFVNSCLFFGHSHFLFSFLNICFSLVSLSCCPFWMYLFFEESLWFDYPFSVTSLSSPFTYFPVISKNHVFLNSFRFLLSLFFLREKRCVPSPIQHFILFECLLSLFIPSFCSSLSTCSLFLSLRARSEGSEGTMSCLRVSGEKTTQDVTVNSWMTCAQQSLHGLIQTACQDEVPMSLTSARSDCAVWYASFSVLPHPTATNALNSDSVGKVLDNTMRNLAGTTLPCNQPQQHRDRVTTCKLWLTFVSSLDHPDVLTLALRSCHK